jgi:hypothetical protein
MHGANMKSARCVTSCVYFLNWDVKEIQTVRFCSPPVSGTWFWSYAETIRTNYKGIKTPTAGQALRTRTSTQHCVLLRNNVQLRPRAVGVECRQQAGVKLVSVHNNCTGGKVIEFLKKKAGWQSDNGAHGGYGVWLRVDRHIRQWDCYLDLRVNSMCPWNC